MIGYVTVGTNDLEKAKAFYDALAAELGAKRTFASERLQGLLVASQCPEDNSFEHEHPWRVCVPRQRLIQDSQRLLVILRVVKRRALDGKNRFGLWIQSQSLIQRLQRLLVAPEQAERLAFGRKRPRIFWI